MPVGRLLRDEASRRGFSHREAAEAIGVSQASFSRWVNGEDLPKPEHQAAIARFLHIPKAEVHERVTRQRRARSPEERMATLERDVAEIKRLVRDLAER